MLLDRGLIAGCLSSSQKDAKIAGRQMQVHAKNYILLVYILFPSKM